MILEKQLIERSFLLNIISVSRDAHLEMGSTGAVFVQTHWSVVLAARDKESSEGLAAWDSLCRTYWAPLYGYIRRRGYRVEDAQDLTQEFVSRLLQKNWLSHLRHQDGKFRSFLLTFLKNFLSDERDRATALKRGGGLLFVPLDAFEAEERAAFEPVDALTAEQIYEKRWTQAVLNAAYARVQEEYSLRGKGPLLDAIKDLQPGEHGEQSY